MPQAEPRATSIPTGWQLSLPSLEERAKGRGISLGYATEHGFLLLGKTPTGFSLTVAEYRFIYPLRIPWRATWVGKAGGRLELEMQEVAHRMLMTAIGDHNDPKRQLFAIFSQGSALTVQAHQLDHMWTIRVPPPPDDLHGRFVMSGP